MTPEIYKQYIDLTTKHFKLHLENNLDYIKKLTDACLSDMTEIISNTTTSNSINPFQDVAMEIYRRSVAKNFELYKELTKNTDNKKK